MKTYIISSITNPNLYYNPALGWGDKAQAAEFTEEERLGLCKYCKHGDPLDRSGRCTASWVGQSDDMDIDMCGCHCSRLTLPESGCWILLNEPVQTNYLKVGPGGVCFAHGLYTEQQCPQMPACATDPQQEKWVALGKQSVEQPRDKGLAKLTAGDLAELREIVIAVIEAGDPVIKHHWQFYEPSDVFAVDQRRCFASAICAEIVKRAAPEAVKMSDITWGKCNRCENDASCQVNNERLCGFCSQRASRASATADPDHLRPDRGGNRAGDDYWGDR